MPMASPVLAKASGLWAHTLPPWALPMSDIKASGTPVGLSSLMLAVNPKLGKHDHSVNSAPNDQCGKRACIGTKEAHQDINISSGHSLPPVQLQSNNRVQPKTGDSKTALEASHNSNQPELELINFPSNPVKGDADSNNGVTVEALGSTGSCDKDSILGVSEEDTNQGDKESDSYSDSRESTADSSPESTAGDDCLICSDTEEAADFPHEGVDLLQSH